jgi:hypothetical protein
MHTLQRVQSDGNERTRSFPRQVVEVVSAAGC